MSSIYNWHYFACAAWLTALVAASGKPGGVEIAYNREVQPILSENCFSCHGTDSAARKANLRLDRSNEATNK